MRRAHGAAGLAVIAALAIGAAPAGAQSVLFMEDAEGEPAGKWVVGTPPDGAEPWQKSDSSTTKFRGNQAKGGATSFWAGVTPTNWPLVPTTAGPGTVIEGEITLTLKEPILVPSDGDTQVKYWSLYQNEGDDAGKLEAAIPAPKLTWKTVKSEAVADASAGSMDPRACDPSQPGAQQTPFEEQTGSLAAYKGAQVLLRFNLAYGAENRPVSHPCGWYVDDIRVLTTGTPGKAGTPAPTGTTPTAATPPPRPTVKLGALKRSSKKATLSLTVSGSDIRNVTATVLKGSKKVASAKVATLATGSRKVTFKLRKAIKKGTYTIRLAGTAADGSAFRASGRARAK